MNYKDAVPSSQRGLISPKGSYSPAVCAGPFLYISGQLPLDANGAIVTGDIVEQTMQALNNIKAILEVEKAGIDNLVQCTLFISDLDFWLEVDRVYGMFLKDVAVLPARAIIPVKQMHYGSMIEIQAVAYLPWRG